MSNNISTLKELREERAKLNREMIIARQYLDIKLEETYYKGKQAVVDNSWSLAISSLVAFGAQQLATRTPPQHYPEPTASFSVVDGIQEGIVAMQKPGKEKWYAMIPLALRFLDQWLSKDVVTNAVKSPPQNKNYPQQTSLKATPSALHRQEATVG